MSSSRVIVPMPLANVDMSALEAFGKITYIFESNQRSAVLRCDAYLRAALSRLRQIRYVPDDDLLAIMPPVLPSALCTTAAFNFAGPEARIRIVVWNPRESKYETRMIDMGAVCTT